MVAGDEVYCEPVLPPVSPEPSDVTELAPRIQLDISDTVVSMVDSTLSLLTVEYTDLGTIS